MYIALEMYDLYAGLAGCCLDGAVGFCHRYLRFTIIAVQGSSKACKTVTCLLAYESTHIIILFMDCNCECGHRCMWSPFEVSQLPVNFCLIKSTLHFSILSMFSVYL